MKISITSQHISQLVNLRGDHATVQYTEPAPQSIAEDHTKHPADRSRQTFCSFLERRLDTLELRRQISFLSRTVEILVNWNAPYQEIVLQAVETLERRDLIEAMLERLDDDRPENRSELEHIRRLYRPV